MYTVAGDSWAYFCFHNAQCLRSTRTTDNSPLGISISAFTDFPQFIYVITYAAGRSLPGVPTCGYIEFNTSRT